MSPNSVTLLLCYKISEVTAIIPQPAMNRLVTHISSGTNFCFRYIAPYADCTFVWCDWWNILVHWEFKIFRLGKVIVKIGTHFSHGHCDGLQQDWSTSIAIALEILQSCTKPSVCTMRLTCVLSRYLFISLSIIFSYILHLPENMHTMRFGLFCYPGVSPYSPDLLHQHGAFIQFPTGQCSNPAGYGWIYHVHQIKPAS